MKRHTVAHVLAVALVVGVAIYANTLASALFGASDHECGTGLNGAWCELCAVEWCTVCGHSH